MPYLMMITTSEEAHIMVKDLLGDATEVVLQQMDEYRQLKDRNEKLKEAAESQGIQMSMRADRADQLLEAFLVDQPEFMHFAIEQLKVAQDADSMITVNVPLLLQAAFDHISELRSSLLHPRFCRDARHPDQFLITCEVVGNPEVAIREIIAQTGVGSDRLPGVGTVMLLPIEASHPSLNERIKTHESALVLEVRDCDGVVLAAGHRVTVLAPDTPAGEDLRDQAAARAAGANAGRSGSISSLTINFVEVLLDGDEKATSCCCLSRLCRRFGLLPPQIVDTGTNAPKVLVSRLIEDIAAGSSLSFDYLMLAAIASALAAVGLATNNAVVIVASMLVSPIMGPIVGTTFGLYFGRYDMVSQGVLTEFCGFMVCILVGAVGGFVMANWAHTPLLAWPTDEMIGRGTVDGLIIGLFVAIPSGFGVALSILGENTASLVGVAISAALLPPLVNGGMCFAYAIYGTTPWGMDQNIDVMQFVEIGAISIALTVMNIICVLAAATAMFHIKSVAPIPGKGVLFKQVGAIKAALDLAGKRQQAQALLSKSRLDPLGNSMVGVAAVGEARQRIPNFTPVPTMHRRRTSDGSLAADGFQDAILEQDLRHDLTLRGTLRFKRRKPRPHLMSMFDEDGQEGGPAAAAGAVAEADNEEDEEEEQVQEVIIPTTKNLGSASLRRTGIGAGLSRYMS